jgi:hypothetical protein
VLGRRAFAFLIIIRIQVAGARTLALVMRSSPAVGILGRGVLKIAQLRRRDRAAGVVKTGCILQQVHIVRQLSSSVANFSPGGADLGVRAIAESSEKIQINSGIPALHNGKGGLRARSEGRVQHQVKLARCGLEIPSDVLTSLVRDGLSARSEEPAVQLLDASLVGAQGTFHQRNPGIQSHRKVLHIISSI